MATTNWSIRPGRALAVLAVLTIAIIAGSATLMLAELRARAVERGRAETADLARSMAQQTGRSFARTDAALRNVIERLQSPLAGQMPLDSLPIHYLLSSRLSDMDDVGAVYLLDARGMVVNSSREAVPEHLDLSDRDYFRLQARGRGVGLYMDAPNMGRLTRDITLHLSRRLANADGSLRGVVVASLTLPQLTRALQAMELGDTHPFALYRGDGRLIVSLPARPADVGVAAPELRGLPLDALGDVRLFGRLDDGGARQVFALAPVPGFALFVGVADDPQEVLAAWRATAVPIAAGAMLACLVIGAAAALLALDLRREERLNQALQDADRRYRQTVDAVTDAIITVDETGAITVFNPAAERLFGIATAAALGRPLELLLPQGLDTAATPPGESVRAQRADGSEILLEAAVSRTRADGRPQLTVALRDITERQRRQAELAAANEELRRLSIALQGVREEERARISRELHDDLGQQLTGLKLDLSWLTGRLREGRQPAPDALDSMRHLLDGAIAAVRRISTELRPRILDDLDFGEAVTWQVGEVARRSGLRVALELPAAELVRDDALATALFRIVQEALTNIARHAAASQVEISLVETAHGLRLRIRDDGRGFDTRRRGSGIGLVSMRERATALGGQFDIASAPGQGTRIEVRVPARHVTEAAA